MRKCTRFRSESIRRVLLDAHLEEEEEAEKICLGVWAGQIQREIGEGAKRLKEERQSGWSG